MELCARFPDQLPFDEAAIDQALMLHTQSKEYMAALAAGGPRYAIDGTVCGEVNSNQQSYARVHVERRQRRKDRRKRIASKRPTAGS
jgi:sRNA-binding protein